LAAVYVTRRLRKDGSAYYGPYFPANLAYRIVDLIHRHFLIPSCKVDLTRFHPRPASSTTSSAAWARA
jgi:excinuclease ABC subunit C